MGNYKIPYSFVEDLLSKVDIVDIISNYISLKKSGRNFLALCPFHSEKTPSFVVSPEKQIFKCFGCGAGGNVVNFVQKYENISFYEAVKRVAEMANVPLPESLNDDNSDVYEELRNVATYFHSNLNSVKDYLEKRHVSADTAEKFLVGYAPSGYIKALKLNSKVLPKLGIVSSRGHELFAGRVVVPIFNHSGKVVGFAGRTMLDKVQPKYINSPESSIFKKGNILFGFYQSRDEILRNRRIIVVEGYFDVTSLYQAGVRGAVAPMGTSLTEDHVRIIKRYCDKPVLMFDGDAAGRKATIRAAGIFMSYGIEPLVVPLPEGEDPDSISVSGKANCFLSNPKGFFDWSIELVKKASQQEKNKLLKDVLNAISRIKHFNPFKFNVMKSRLMAEFSIDETWVKLNMVKEREKQQNVDVEYVPPYEKAFLRAVMDGDLEIPIEISPNVFTSDLSARFYSMMSSTSLKEIPMRYPELSDFIAELKLSEFSYHEKEQAVKRVIKKELLGKLKRIKDFDEKKSLKSFSTQINGKGLDEVFECLKTFKGG